MAPARGLAAVLILLVVGMGGCGDPGYEDYKDTYHEDLADQAKQGIVDRYCEYGAVSRAQLNGCESHVSLSYVQGLRTNAARYAAGDLRECLADAGPFCR